MGDPYQVLKVTGEWNSKTTEYYIGMCKAEITGSKEIQQDLAYMAGQWRDTVVREIGRERYNDCLLYTSPQILHIVRQEVQHQFLYLPFVPFIIGFQFHLQAG